MTPSENLRSNESTDESTDFAIRRLHPISLLFEVISGGRKILFPAVIGGIGAARGNLTWLGIAVVAFSIQAGFAFIRYMTLRYQFRDNELIVDEGFLFRRHRTVPIQRIQNIDLLQNPLHRLFHVAEVRVETASGKEPEATLRVLSIEEVARLRSQIFARRTVLHADPSPSIVDVSQTHGENDVDVPSLQTNQENARSQETVQAPVEVLRIPTGLLVQAGLISNRGMVIVAIVMGAFFESGWMDDRVQWSRIGANWVEKIIGRFGGQWLALGLSTLSVLVAGLVLLRLFSAVWYVLRFHGYVLERVEDELRVRCGLFTKLSATIPRKRIQFISVHRTCFSRWLKLASIRIETAGGSGKQSEDAAASVGRRWFVPIVQEKDLARLIAELRPGLEWCESPKLSFALSPRAASRMKRLNRLIVIVVSGAVAWFHWPIGIGMAIVLLPSVGWLAEKKAKAKRYARWDSTIFYRSGLFYKKSSVTFLDKIQSVAVRQSPFDRRWSMATLALDTAAAGPSEHRIEIDMLDADFAFAEQSAIARQASSKALHNTVS